MDDDRSPVSDHTPHARSDDPATSHEAWGRLSTKATHIRRLMRAYRENPQGLTTEEAARLAGLDRHAAARRVPDMRVDGLLDFLVDENGTRVTRQGSSGRPACVFVAV